MKRFPVRSAARESAKRMKDMYIVFERKEEPIYCKDRAAIMVRCSEEGGARILRRMGEGS